MSIPAGLYVHVPFCAVKCPYCDFYSNPYRRERAEAYAARVAENIAAYPAELSVDTVYFGGGTPSILPPPLLGQMLHAARRRFSLAADTEITLEVNPLTATPAALDAWRGLGVNRLSFGMQSAVDAELYRLGRRHTAAQGIAAVDRAAAAGFQNISCDLMLGTPGQTGESLAQSLAVYAQLPIAHVSAYLLSIESGTPFDTEAMRSQVPDGDAAALLYVQMAECLEQQGFRQYEISNFARPGFESRHNLKYWQCVDSSSPSACSGASSSRSSATSIPDRFSSFRSGEKAGGRICCRTSAGICFLTEPRANTSGIIRWPSSA